MGVERERECVGAECRVWEDVRLDGFVLGVWSGNSWMDGGGRDDWDVADELGEVGV